MVVGRCYRGPLWVRSHLHRLGPEDREALWRWQQEHEALGRTPLTLAVAWCDGKRALLEVADMVEQACGQRDTEVLVGCCELLAKMRLLEVH